MKDFLLLFRNDHDTAGQLSPEQMQESMKQWMDWMGGIAAQNKLVDRGNRLRPEGTVIKPGHVVTDGPFTEIKEVLGGYTVVKADSLAEATELAKGCPILARGGNVEIREIATM
jgi:hypothetical protein